MDRGQLIAQHLPYVKRTARGLFNVPAEREDMEQAGCEALCRCAAEYDAARSDSFWAYAYRRVRGAMLDEARRWTGYGHDKKRRPDPAELDEERAAAVPDCPFPLDVLTCLPARERELCLALAAGEKPREVAARWHVTESRVSQLLARARERIQETSA